MEIYKRGEEPRHGACRLQGWAASGGSSREQAKRLRGEGRGPFTSHSPHKTRCSRCGRPQPPAFLAPLLNAGHAGERIVENTKKEEGW